MSYFKELKSIILDNEAYEAIKDDSKEKNKVMTYFEIGGLIYEAEKHYGKEIIEQYTESLKKDFGKKFDKKDLNTMKQFYLLIKNQNSL